jgi:RimJ/RimL family protein N-acetyltransferase
VRHNIKLDGPAYRLRPICDADAALVIELRSDATLGRFLHATSQKLSDQLGWFAQYYKRHGDYYFVVERKSTGNAEGLISIYDIIPEEACGEWGRWIIKPGSLAAIESAWLIYKCSFEMLGLERVYCRTVAENKAAVSFQDSCGIQDRRVLSGHFNINGVSVDAVQHQVSVQTWPEVGAYLERLAKLTARRLQGSQAG